jgi:hypothetical protein
MEPDARAIPSAIKQNNPGVFIALLTWELLIVAPGQLPATGPAPSTADRRQQRVRQPICENVLPERNIQNYSNDGQVKQGFWLNRFI